jgi:hypothetical protein
MLRQVHEAQDNFAALAVAQTTICVAKVEGPPGNGKTATCSVLADRLNEAILEGTIKRFGQPLGFMAIQPNTLLREDFGGFPYLGDLDTTWDPNRPDEVATSRKVMCRAEDATLALAEDQPHVILADELADVHWEIQGAMLGYMARRHGKSVFMAASNPEEMATNPTPLRPAFVSRMWHGTWSEHPVHWAQRASVTELDADGMLREYYPPLPVPIVSDNWLLTRPTWNAALANFCDAYPRESELDAREERFKSPGAYSNACPVKLEEQSRPFPCDRTRQLCSYGLAAATDIGATSRTLRDVTEGFLGLGASEAFWCWFDNMDLQDGLEILLHPEQMREPDSPMAAHLTMAGVLKAWGNGRTASHWANMIAVFNQAYDWSPDLCQCFFPTVLAAQPDGETLMRSPAIDSLANITYGVHSAVKTAKEAQR